MTHARPFGLLRRPGREWEQAIDLGGGRTVRPEDLMEGHFQRLSKELEGSQEVNVRVSPNSSTVIRVSAPALAPLAQIAEELASKIPTVQPSAGFRTGLHRELEDAHRRYLEERAHGESVRRRRPASGWLWLALATVALSAACLWLLRRRR